MAERKELWSVSNDVKKEYIDALVPELKLLRAKADISQDDLASILSISRQTYCQIENGNKDMSWNIYLSLIFFFDSIEVAPGVHANGRFTLGENIADHGGLQVSFQAFKNATKDAPLAVKDGLTPEQRFFLAYATVWADNIRPEEILVRTKSDPHSLGRWRVNGALPQIGAWYDAFGVQPGDPMYVAPEDRVSIW